MRTRLLYMLILCQLSGFLSVAQDRSNRGKEFWLAYGFNYGFINEPPVNQQELALYISAEQAATVTVSIAATGWSQTLNIPANTVDATVLIPKSGPDDARVLADGMHDRGIHIVSDVPVAVYAHVYAQMVSGATMLMPVETYGYSYYSINYYQTTSQSNPPDWYSWFYVIATEDNTRVEITPSDSTKNGWLPGQTYTINLNKGQSYHVFGKAGPFNTSNYALCSKDMTGSKIISVPGADGNCHPVAVFSGSGGIRLCRGDGGEFMHQQVFPAHAWGTRYLTYHTLNNPNTDINETFRNYYRVCVQDPATVVKRNGVVLTGLIKSFYYEFMDSTGGDYITSDKPVLVSQYTPNKNQCWAMNTNSYGDPEMFYLSPIEQGQKSVLFYTSRKHTIDFVYVNVHVPTVAVNSLLVDGAGIPAANTRLHPNNPDYTIAVKRLTGPAAQHTITCDSAFTATVYGLGFFESYGYNVGTLINNLNNYSEISNTFNTTGNIDTFTCPKSPVRLYVKLGHPATSIHWKLSQVPGISPNADSLISNPVPVRTELINGRTYYVYTLDQDFTFSQTGTYYIPVSYTATVIENCSQTENAVVKVVVKPGPVADFTFPAPACLLDSIPFTGTSVAGSFNLAGYNWLFADNSTASTVNTVKLFSSAGPQDVRYRIYADNGCIGDTIKTVTILESPLAAFTVSGNSCAGDSVLITDASSIPAGSVSAWQWDFGDGSAATHTGNNAFYHSYPAPGNYIISLVTVSASGCKSDTAFVPVTVLPKPLSKFGYSGNICVGDSVRFSDSSSVSSGSISAWQWNFGDGQTAVLNNNTPFYHPYTTAGNYVVTLVVTGSNGCVSDTFRLTVNVSTQPAAVFTLNGKPCTDSIQSFTSSVPAGSPNAPAWHWDFGDGQTFSSATVHTATHAYTAAQAAVPVKHWVSYSAGCSSDTAVVVIPVIFANPVAGFTAGGDPFCESKPVTFTSTLTGISSWTWNMGNGTRNTQPPFSHNYSVAGQYTISLVVKTAEGCSSLPVSEIITINPAPQVNAGPDKFIKLGTSVTLEATISNPANYNILWTPSLYLNSPTLLNPVSAPADPVTYTILATDKNTGCSATDEVLITPVSDIFVPTAFTPNNDGRNDTWKIPGLALYPEATVSVFNRWGEMVYQTKAHTSNPWNGYFKGVKQPVGVYVYVIHIPGHTPEYLKGTVTIIQ